LLKILNIASGYVKHEIGYLQGKGSVNEMVTRSFFQGGME
jgi:hypothetical protein